MARQGLPHSSHWGAFSVLLRGDGIEVVPHPEDRDPSNLLGNIPASVSHRARIARPMVRRGWLEGGPGPDPRRGRDELVPVSWSRALDLVAAELRRVYAIHGPRAVFGGSYGWASAGRFHDAQSQIHRFLNLAGGQARDRVRASRAGPSAGRSAPGATPRRVCCRAMWKDQGLADEARPRCLLRGASPRRRPSASCAGDLVSP